MVCAITTTPTLGGGCQQAISAVIAELRAHGYQVGAKTKNGEIFETSPNCLDGLDGYYSTIYFSPFVDPCAGKTAAQIEYINKVAAQHERDYPGEIGFRCQ